MVRWPKRETPTKETFELAKTAVEKLTSEEFRALGECSRSLVFWPGLVEWHSLMHPIEPVWISCRDMDELPPVVGFPTMRDDFGRVWPKRRG